MEALTGRPSDLSGRLDKEKRVYDLLDRLDVSYQQADHPPLITMSARAEVERLFQAIVCKNLFLRDARGSHFYLLVILGDKRFKTSDISRQIGSSRLSFAPAEDLERLLDIAPGSVSVLGLMNDRENQVQLLLDRAVPEDEFLLCHPCVNTSSLKLRSKDLLEKILPTLRHQPVFVHVAGD